MRFRRLIFMNLNRLRKTGVEISELGLGGFHLIEIELDTVRKIVEEYLITAGIILRRHILTGTANRKKNSEKFCRQEI